MTRNEPYIILDPGTELDAGACVSVGDTSYTVFEVDASGLTVKKEAGHSFETLFFRDGAAFIEFFNAQSAGAARLLAEARTTAVKNRRTTIMSTIEDLVGSFLYYDRKEDESLGRGDIEAAIEAGVITADEIAAHFKRKLEVGLV